MRRISNGLTVKKNGPPSSEPCFRHDRPDVAAARVAWHAAAPTWDVAHLVFLDETGITTNLLRTISPPGNDLATLRGDLTTAIANLRGDLRTSHAGIMRTLITFGSVLTSLLTGLIIKLAFFP